LIKEYVKILFGTIEKCCGVPVMKSDDVVVASFIDSGKAFQAAVKALRQLMKHSQNKSINEQLARTLPKDTDTRHNDGKSLAEPSLASVGKPQQTA